MPTLVIASDIAEIYHVTRSNIDTWRGNGWLGDPDAIVSGHAVWVYESLAPRLRARMNPQKDTLRGRPPVHREPDAEAVERVRARSEVDEGVVPVGLAEIGWCTWLERRLVSSPGILARLPDPIARLGRPLKPDGTPARQDPVYDLRAVAHWPEFDRRERGAELLATRRIA